jgi:endogenous inhibitor of DNA gyrase (YacG/DUF329 family)
MSANEWPCPKCGQPVPDTGTRHAVHGVRHTRRDCPHCGAPLTRGVDADDPSWKLDPDR